MAKVKLTGMNVPLKFLEELSCLTQSKHDFQKLMQTPSDSNIDAITELLGKFTPEILSAAYARISRSPNSVDELVGEAWNDVAKARKSNENIIYGIGHHSVADHALFNYNITNISRLAVESVEESRIGVGATEKSQRYVTLAGDYVKPKEYSLDDLNMFEGLVKLQNDFYFRTNEKIFEHLKRKFSSELEKMDDKGRKNLVKKLEGMAKEDARYVLSLATATQLGCSFQGQTVEHVIRKMNHGRLAEEREISGQLYDETVKHASSLIQLADPELFKQHNSGKELDEDNFRHTKNHLREIVEQAFRENKHLIEPMHYKKSAKVMEDPENKNVRLIRCKSIDGSILSALLFSNSKESAKDSYALNYLLQKKQAARGFMMEALKYISAFDKVPREFEMNNGLVYEIILSSGAFGQLKRHRMMTLLSQDYNPDLGFTVPDNIKEAGCEEEFKDIIDKSSELYREFLPKYGKAAEYCLTNAHRKRALVGVNMRELHHISRLREDEHAQWDIRNISGSMTRLAKQAAPLTSFLLGGKDEFESIKNKVYNP